MIESHWDQVKEAVRCKLTDVNFATWVKPLGFHSVEGEMVRVSCPNKFIRDWVQDHYLGLLRLEWFNLTGKSVEILFMVREEPQGEAGAPEIAPVEPAPDLRRLPQRRHAPPTPAGLNPKYTFENFVVGTANQFAHAASYAVADLPAGRYNPLFIYGGVGLGKTHLLHAIGNGMDAREADKRILYTTAEKFANEVINSIRFQKMPELRRKYRDTCDVLLIDDIQFIAGKERTQEEFFHTFNYLHESHRQIVLTSDRLPRDMPGLEERLRSRFEWGLIADIQPPDLETRVAILRKKSEEEGIELPDELSAFLAARISHNVRELEGSLIRIAAFSSLTNTPLSIDLAKEVLKNMLDISAATPSVESIQKIVADYFQIRHLDLTSSRRPKRFAEPRQIAMYLCRKHTKNSYPELGDRFGGKDHTTVIHAVQKITSRLAHDPLLQQHIESISKRLPV